MDDGWNETIPELWLDARDHIRVCDLVVEMTSEEVVAVVFGEEAPLLDDITATTTAATEEVTKAPDTPMTTTGGDAQVPDTSTLRRIKLPQQRRH